MKQDKRLGEPISSMDLDTTPIADSNFFSMDAPFSAETSAKAKINTEYAPKENVVNKPAPVEKQAAPAPVVGEKEAKKGRRYITNEEASPHLKTFRELFGLKRIDVKYYSTKRVNADGEEIVVTFGLRPLNFEDFQWIIDKAASIQNISIEQLGSNSSSSWTISYKQAEVAVSICTLDIGIKSTENPGTPIWKVLGVEPVDPSYTKDPNYPHVVVRSAAADLMFEELNGTFYDLVADLHDAIATLIDTPYSEIKRGDHPLASTTSNK